MSNERQVGGDSLRFRVDLLSSKDAPRLIDARLRALHESPWAFGVDPADESVADAEQLAKRLDGPDEAVFAVESIEDARTLVAMAGVTRASEPQFRHRARIWGVYVDPAFRGHGLGKAVVEAAIEHARSWQGVDYVDLGVSENSPEALALYTGLGFEEWGREPEATDFKGQRFDEVFMTLRLQSPR